RANSNSDNTGQNEARAGARTGDTAGPSRSAAARTGTADSTAAGTAAVGPVEVPVTELTDAVPVTDLLTSADDGGRHVGQFTDTPSPAGTALSSLTEPIGPTEDDCSLASGLLA
ncbi:MAG TPA: hypothetical protein VNP03_25545, partial [Pseudonocardia sp.]|nr:hypothetical protein [Pseudonocardia sp.]